MVKINNFEILEEGGKLAIDVETTVGFSITSILLWDSTTFKDYTAAVDLSYKLVNINNKEVFFVTAIELGITSFDNVNFIEVETNDTTDTSCDTCQLPTLGITYNLAEFKTCLINYILELKNTGCPTCNGAMFNDTVLMINLLIETIENCFEIGYYTQALDALVKLKKICSFNTCKDCKTVACASCNKFKQH